MRTFLAKHWFLILLVLGLGLALTFPVSVHTVADFWEPRIAVAVSLFLIALTMPARALVEEMRRPLASVWAVVLSYGFVPLAGAALGWFAPDDVGIGLILVSCVPCTLSSAVIWTRLAGGNEATALLTVMGTTFTSWFLTTAWLTWLTQTEVPLDVAGMMRDLVLSLIVPTLAGQAVRWMATIAHFAERHKVALGVASQCLVLAIVLKAGAGVGDKLHEIGVWDAPQIFAWSIVLAVLLHLLALAGGFLSSRWFGFDRARQIGVAFACSQKTLPVSLVLYEEYFKPYFPLAVAPLLAYHVGQLLLDTMIAKRLRRWDGDCEAPGER